MVEAIFNTMQNPSMHFVAISEYQKQRYNGLANIITVQHGIEMRYWHFKMGYITHGNNNLITGSID